MLKVKLLTKRDDGVDGYKIKLHLILSEREYKEFLKFLAQTKIGEPKIV